MKIRDTPIRRKLMLVILLTSVTVLLVARMSYFIFEYVTFRAATTRQVSTLAKVIAANSTAALAFDNREDAQEVLSSLQAEQTIVAACLYGKEGEIFSRYPATLPASAFPAAPGNDGFQFSYPRLDGFQPVVQGGNKRLGTLYLEYDVATPLHEGLRNSLLIAIPVFLFALLVAMAISALLQRQISRPILSLAKTARDISDRRDYSVRATKQGEDELGLLTDAFNQMLAQIQERDTALSRARDELELRVHERTAELGLANEGLQAEIVERKRTEVVLEHERYLLRTLMDNVPDRIWFKDLESRFQRNNRAHTKMFNQDDPQQLVGKTDFDFFTEEHARQAFDDEQQIIRTGEPVFKEEKETWPDGSVTWALTSKLPLRDEQRRIIGTFGISRDITERKLAEDKLQKLADNLVLSNHELASLNKELEAFSYSVSHDLRAPLRHISGFVELLSKSSQTSLDDSGKRSLGIIADSAKKMGQLIDDLLVFSHLGRNEMRWGMVNTDELVAEVVREMSPDLTGRIIEWEIGTLPEVFGDRAMLKQVWVNLLSNAVKYSQRRERAVIKVAGCKNASGDCEFSVHDNGAGFDMQYAGKLFGVFQRLHQAEEFEGTGIGLANVQRIVLRHGGRVWAEGKIDAGATFYYSLPRIKKEKT